MVTYGIPDDVSYSLTPSPPSSPETPKVINKGYGLSNSPGSTTSITPEIPGALPWSPRRSPRTAPSPGSSPTGVRKSPGPQVPKKRGRLGKYQGKLSLPVGKEVPGEKIQWSSERPENGDVWFKLREPTFADEYVTKTKTNDRDMCREVIDNEDNLDLESIRDVAKVMSHPNLVNLVDDSGFGRRNVRKETAWEFCDAGTLNSLILAHGEALPESLIWHTICSLLEAVLYLNIGSTRSAADRPGAKEGWKPIVHNAINPANIFYQKPRIERGWKTPTYGRCKLGNFSRSMVIKDPIDDVQLLDLWEKGVGGEWTGYEAPDLSDYKGEPDFTDEKTGEKSTMSGKTVGSASDIWSIGAVAVAMMTGNTIWHLVLRENIKTGMMSRRFEDWKEVWPPERYARLIALTSDNEEGIGASKLWQILPLTYSEDLRLLVENFLTMDPWQRWDVRDKRDWTFAARHERKMALKKARDETRDEYQREGAAELPYDPEFPDSSEDDIDDLEGV